MESTLYKRAYIVKYMVWYECVEYDGVACWRAGKTYIQSNRAVYI